MEKKKKSSKTIWWIVGLSSFAVVLLMVSQFMFTDNIINTDKFYDNTLINGVDVSGLSKEEASNIISTKMLDRRNDVVLTLSYNGKMWEFKGSDFEANNEIIPVVEKAFNVGRVGNTLDKKKELKSIRENGLNVKISYKNVLGGIDEKIDEIIKGIEKAPKEPEIKFKPDNEKMFTLISGEDGVCVQRDALMEEIDRQFSLKLTASVEIPITLIPPEMNGEELIKHTKIRSKFSTSYATSSVARKHNVGLALSKFNGMIIKPNEEVSFNLTTGARSEENGYKKANVILNGVYVSGSGGGVCQSSTTLYNALVLADMEVLESSHHSLPVSYVPLAFDAMVSEGYSDLKFKNPLEYPVYIKTYGNSENIFVEVYGAPFEAGMEVKRRADFIKTIPHKGDVIIEDVNGEYSEKVIYKGEYYRVKFPREGYESKAYLDYYKDGVKISEKLLRHDIYDSQQGLIIEGTSELGEGMVIPDSGVEYIGPQNVNAAPKDEKTAIAKINKNSPTEYNP